MAEADTAPAIAARPTWQRVPELVDLVEVFDPAVQICTWQRQLDPDIQNYLSELTDASELQRIETLWPALPPKLEVLPDKAGRAALIADLCLLRDIVCELLGCQSAGMRLARTGRAMCPGWHVDRTGIRLVCTYQGPGTQWLDDQGSDRLDLQSDETKKARYIEALPGEIVLLKGALWQENETFGAIHRSPDLGAAASLRTVVTLDPLWHD